MVRRAQKEFDRERVRDASDAKRALEESGRLGWTTLDALKDELAIREAPLSVETK